MQVVGYLKRILFLKQKKVERAVKFKIALRRKGCCHHVTSRPFSLMARTNPLPLRFVVQPR